MVGNTNNVLVEYDYQNIILVDPNKLISDDGKAEERLVDHEDMVMYASLTCKLVPRTKLAIGADLQNSIREVTLAEIDFLKQQTLDGRNALNNAYTDEITGKDTLKGEGINQPRNTSVKVPTKDGSSQEIIKQDTVNKGKTGSFNTGLLGITSINIKTSGSFIPTVTIDFEDVRGRALFERGDQSPYAAFFHMPYPIFYLTIKGYYGKAVRYPLQLSTFNSRFNTMTGNYQITCVFYSYKYGVLADLSMGSLYSLPTMYQSEYDLTTPDKSIAGQSTTTQNQSSNSTSTSVTQTTSKGSQKLYEVYSDYKSKGLVPQDFPEINIQQLKYKLETLEDFIKAELGKQDMGSLTDADTYSEDLKNYRQAIYSQGNQSWFDKNIDQNSYVYDKNKIKIFFFKPIISTDATAIDKAKKDLQSLVDEYNGKLSRNKTFGVGGTFNGEPFEIPNQINVNTFNYGPIDVENGIDYEYTYRQINGSVPNEAQLSGFTKLTKDYLLNNSLTSALNGDTKEGFFFDGKSPDKNIIVKKGFINLISEMLGKDGLQKKKEIIERKLSDILANILESKSGGLGFRPTLKNIIAVIFASSEAFLRLLDDVHTDAWVVRNELARKNSILKNPGGGTTTENKDFIDKLSATGETAEYPVYPWPQFFSEKKDDKGNTRYEITYPADDNIIDLTQAYDYFIWPEVEFEEEFIRSMIDRNKPPLPYVDNNTNNAQRVSLNAVEFPIGNKPFTNRQITKFVYEMWERFILSSSYNGIFDENLVGVFAEMEDKNLEKSSIDDDPFLLNLLKEKILVSANMENILSEISNQGVGESYQLYNRALFVTRYIKTALDNSFVILGREYYDYSGTTSDVALSDESKNKLLEYLTGNTNTQINSITSGTKDTRFINLFPYAISGWAQSNLSKLSDENILQTSKVLTYNQDKKLITNFENSQQPETIKRPYTNLSMVLPGPESIPKVENIAGLNTIGQTSFPSFYERRYDKVVSDRTYRSSDPCQMITEGRINYQNYTNLLTNKQTTSMLNTPIFVNAMQKGVENYFFTNSASNPPYVEAAYLFINSLPLSTLKEKYVSVNGTKLTDLNYLFASFKKHSALHKVPYAWVLKYGSIWHRYKRWIEKGVDFLDEVWKNYDYKLNWDPSKSNVTSWDISDTTVTLSNSTNNNVEIGLGFYPNTVNLINYFLQSNILFTGYTADDVKKPFIDKDLMTITGSPTSDRFFITGYNLSNTAETLSLKTYTFLADTGIPKKGKYVLPSFGSNLNQVYFEFFSGNTMVIPISGNTSMYNGSVRMFHALPNYGFFDISKIKKPRPDQYIKEIIPTDERQTAFSFGSEDSYSSIEEIFSVFDKDSLDQFEIQFLNWAKASDDVDGSLPIKSGQFDGASDIDGKNKTTNENFNNFQRLFRQLMFIDDSDLQIDNLSSYEKIKKIQTIQYRNFQNSILSFLSYDVVIKYGNPTFFDRRVFYSMVNTVGNNSGNVIDDPINFGIYGDVNSGSVPTTNTRNIPLASLKSGSNKAWKALETYVGFSNIDGIKYSNTGSTITDFFVDNNISFNAENIKILAPLIKIYATKKKINPLYNSVLFQIDINSYLNYLKKIRDSSFDIFAKTLRKKVDSAKPVRKIKSQGANLQGNQTRVELWETFKALNDKWVAGNNYTNRTLFEDVLFLDRASRDIGDKVFVDIYKLKSQMTNVNMDGRIMGFLMDMIQENNFVIMSLPAYVNFYNVQDVNPDIVPRIEGSADFANTLFGTHLTVDIRNSSPKLVCFYVDKVSEHPEIENSEYRWGTDSFDLRRFSDNPLIENQVGKNDWGRSNKVVGFNVDVGIRNQNMFSNISLAQDPGKATAESVRILDLMANSASGKQTATQNVSLFNLYKTRSYTCTVESMGNAMIQPTMYFNLRHVPMFNGPYMILSVEHSIQPGSFRTTFSGVRQSKYSLPLIEDFIQNIYKVYLTKFIEDVRRDIAKEESKSRNKYAIDANNITNSKEKSETLSDCTPKNSENARNYVLTDDSNYRSQKTFTENNIKDILSGITETRTRLLVYSAIYNNSYSSGNYYAFGNNLLGFNLDYQIIGSLGNLLVKQYVCAQAGDNKIPLAIFKNTDDMINFGKNWFEPYAQNLKGKIEAMAESTLVQYSSVWQERNNNTQSINDFIKTTEGKIILERFEKANKNYLKLFPEDKNKTF